MKLLNNVAFIFFRMRYKEYSQDNFLNSDSFRADVTQKRLVSENAITEYPQGSVNSIWQSLAVLSLSQSSLYNPLVSFLA